MTNFACENNTSLSWKDVFEKLTDSENSREKFGLFANPTMKEISKIVESNIVTLILELKEYDLGERNVIEMRQMFCVILVKSVKHLAFINFYTFLCTSGALKYLLFPGKVEEVLWLKENHNKEIIDENNDIKSRKGIGGQPALTKLFPEIIDLTAEFIK